MNQQEILNLIKTMPHEHLKIAQFDNGVINIQILPFQQKPKKVAIGKEALAIFQKNGFVGCLHEDANFSENYKQELDWNEKL